MKRTPRIENDTRFGQMLRLAASGSTDKEIAATLGLSENTVESYWKRIRDRYDVPSRTAAVVTHLKVQAERSNRELLDSQQVLCEAFEQRGREVANLVHDVERMSGQLRSLHEDLRMYRLAVLGSAPFRYEVEPNEGSDSCG